MNWISKLSAGIVLISLILSGAAFAETKGRIMTDGRISMYKNGHLVSSYTDQGPIDENSLIGCEGTCMIKMQGIVFNASDESLFALKDTRNAINLFVKQGKIYFVISDTSHRFTFYTPDGYYIETEGFIAPASTANSVKGFIRVSGKETELGMDSGTMVVKTHDGNQIINPGQSILLALADVPNSPESGGAAPVGGTDPVWANMSTYQQIGTITLGVGAVAGVGYLATRDSSSQISVGTGTQSTPSASPNR